MDIATFTTFVAVARARSLTRAAKELGVKQSTVSRQVQKLEQALGARLLVRTRQGIVLTLAGEKSLERIQSALATVHTLRAEVSSLQESPKGVVHVGAIMSLGSTLVPHVMVRTKRRHPNVSVQIQEGLSEDLAILVDRGELDMALLAGPLENSANKTEKLWSEGYLLVVTKAHKLAKRDHISSLKEAVREPVALLKSRVASRTLDVAGQSESVRPQIAMETDNLESLRRIVEAGVASAVIPELLRKRIEGWKAKALPIRDPNFRRDVFLLYPGREYMSSAARMFRDELINEARSTVFRKRFLVA